MNSPGNSSDIGPSLAVIMIRTRPVHHDAYLLPVQPRRKTGLYYQHLPRRGEQLERLGDHEGFWWFRPDLAYSLEEERDDPVVQLCREVALASNAGVEFDRRWLEAVTAYWLGRDR